MSDIPGHAQQKWSEIEHLPEWDEEFYHVYTAKKYGKWLMLKTLRPEFRDDPKYRQMLEKEFDVRYNLAHPHIIMINDLEEVPGLGMCIIADDVYGESLRKIIDSGKVDDDILQKVVTQLVLALEYIQTNHIVHHPINSSRVIFTENIHNLKLIDVGFDQKEHLTPADAKEDIYNFGVILKEVLDAMPSKGYERLRKVANRCMDPEPERRYRDIQHLKAAVNGTTSNRLYISVITFLVLMVIVLAWLNSSYRPATISEQNRQAQIETVTGISNTSEPD